MAETEVTREETKGGESSNRYASIGKLRRRKALSEHLPLKSKRQKSHEQKNERKKPNKPKQNIRKAKNEKSANEENGVCKPLFVRLTRLPDTLVNQNTTNAKLPKKKAKRTGKWKNGIHQTKRLLKRPKGRAAQSHESRILDDQVSVKAALDSCDNFDGAQTVDEGKIVASPRVRSDKVERVVENIPQAAEKEAKSEYTLDAKAHVHPTEEPPVKSLRREEAGSTVGDDETILSKAATAKKSDKLFQHSKEARNRVRPNEISRQAAKRKRLSGGPYDRQKSTRLFKKQKNCSAQTEDSPEADNAKPESLCFSTSNTDSPKVIRDRRKSKETHSPKEALVYVTRLDDLHSTLINKWKRSVALAETSVMGIGECSAIENHVENEKNGGIDSFAEDNASQLTETFPTSVRAEVASEGGERGTPNGIVMCDSNEDDSDEDDEEIIAYMSTSRRSRQFLDTSYLEDSNDKHGRKVRLSRNSNSDASIIRSEYDSRSDLQRNEQRSPSRQSTISDEPVNSVITPGERSSTLQCDQTWESDEDQSRTNPPLTRSRSRAAHKNTTWVNPVVPQPRQEPPKHNLHLVSSTETPKEKPAEENVETQVSTESDSNITREVLEREPNDENVGSPEVSAFRPLDAVRIASNDISEDVTARKKLAAMKNAMVVLTPLEDLRTLVNTDLFEKDNIEPCLAYEMEFSSEFCQDSIKEDVGSDYDPNEIESRDNDEGVTDRSSADPLEIDRTPVDQRQSYESSFTGCLGPKKSQRSNASESRKPEIGCPRKTTDRIDTDQPEEASTQESVESDVELSLVFEESDHGSSEVRVAPNGIDDRPALTFAPDAPEEELGRERNREKTQTASTQPLPQTESTEIASSSTNAVSCANVSSAVPQEPKIRSPCKSPRKRASVNQVVTEETTAPETAVPETITPETTAPETASQTVPNKDKKQRQPSQKTSKKSRSKPRCRSDNLTCNVCSTSFETKTALSEHLYRHSSVELQEAFRIAKAKAIADAKAKNAREKDKTNNVVENKTGTDADEETARNVDEATSSAEAHDSSTSTLATVCLCHRDNDQTSLGNTDLQIEMVLLCKYCHVLFRRRECLEVHYRTSAHCASDRTRERWPRLFCANCQLCLNNWADMRQHLEIHARQNAECAIRFVCNICRVVFVGFGSLFYNHWISHSKDSMFVAGRYNFPKFSVQRIDGTEKLPAGARSEENYIFVAEHVCGVCKKPFSMRRDLEAHQQVQCVNPFRKPQPQSQTTVKRTEDSTNNYPLSPFWCDACYVLFASEKAINDHGANEHGNHYVFVKAGLLANRQPFRCTKCVKVASSIKAIDDHWALMHDRPVSTESTAPVASSISERIPVEAPPVTVTDKTSTSSPPLVTIPEDDVRINNPQRTQTSTSSPAINRKSVSSAPKPIESDLVTSIEQLPVLRSVLELPTSRAIAEKKSSKTRALEDPSVKVVVSDARGENLSASLVINDAQESAGKNETTRDPETYRILVTDQSSMGGVTTVLNTSAKTTEKPREITVSSASPTNRTETTTKNAAVPIVTRLPSSVETPSVSVPRKTTSSPGKPPTLNDAKKTRNFSPATPTAPQTVGTSVETRTGSSSVQATERRHSIPEVIDIVDDDAEASPSVAQQSSTQVHQNTGDSNLRDKRSRDLREFRKTSFRQSPAGATNTPVANGDKEKPPENCSGSETSSITGRNANGPSSRPKLNPSAAQAARISYEEERWNWLRSNSGSVETRKQGFLRVKDLSELQAVRTHVCCVCSANFQTEAELIEHGRVHTNTVVSYTPQMSAALALPDTPECPRISQNSNGQATVMNVPGWSYIPQRIFDPLINQRNPTANDTLGSWISMGNQNTIAIPSSSTNTAYVAGSSVRPAVLPEITNTIIATSTGFSQIQTSAGLVGGSEVQDPNQRLPENRVGYHVLPPVVVLPTGQSGKTVALTNQRNSSNNFLPGFCINGSPLTYRPNKPNKFLCNICHTFECDSIDTFNFHVTKHYTGWKSSQAPPVNSPQPSPVAMIAATTVTIPNLVPIDSRPETNQISKTSDASANGKPLNNWTVNETPTGTLLVPPLNANTDHRPLPSFVENNNRNVLRQTPLNSSKPNANNKHLNHIVLRCMICKSALYKNYPPLRNHVILVHGVTDFSLLGLDNIAQKSYHCTLCPSTTALFDCEKKYHEHVETIHHHPCPTCRRVFSNFVTLRHHLDQCRVSSSNDRNNYGKNC